MGCFLFFPRVGLQSPGLAPHLTWVAPAQEHQGSGPRRPLPLSLHSVYPMGPKSSSCLGPEASVPGLSAPPPPPRPVSTLDFGEAAAF